MSLRSRLLSSLPALLLLLPGTPLRAQPFTDLVDFPRNEANWDRFYDLEAHLARRFAAVCADTLCEGEYSNLRALQLRCSVDAARAQVQACTWLFVASELAVAADTGQVQADNRRWACALPLGAGVPVEAFHAALEGEAPLAVTLPGARTSLGAAVGACLQAPRPPATAHAGTGPYVDARDYPRPGLGQAPMQAMEQALVRGFDNICGDTFCEGEYYNLQAMRLRCSVHVPSGRAGQCVWTFAGSQLAVDTATGAVTVDARDWACPLPLAPGTAWPQLLATLQGAEAIDTVLPGTGTTVYEGLTGCL
ncbi:hypothetical protein [Stenotrophomonas sp.]|uniref:hypothetical protein n=1 Tax=Stenotrophomonas sp. TaxID=69392 RepID=UPI002FCB76A5